MGLPIPGLGDALAKLEETAGKLDIMIERFDRVIELLEEQNDILRER